MARASNVGETGGEAMDIHPVILCGGSGARLWPASSPSEPKPFLDLTGRGSMFQDTLARLDALPGAAAPLVVCGRAHAGLVRRQAAALGRKVHILLEPQPRDSAAAIAAAAAWVFMRDREGLLAIVAADHHVPDAGAFAAAIAAASHAARAGGLVTLGVRPTHPACSYGYIAPGPPTACGVRDVRRFVEKPKAQAAVTLVRDGCLWNSGNLIARADVLLEELRAHAPQVACAAAQAVAESRSVAGARLLGRAFLDAPRVSFDYAVLEKTGRAKVLPVDFAWSDLGAWDAVHAAAPKDAAGNCLEGPARLVDVQGSLVRVAEGGPAVTVLGLSGVAVIGRGDHLLICSLSHSQQVKALAEVAADGAGPGRPSNRERALDLWQRRRAGAGRTRRRPPRTGRPPVRVVLAAE